VDIDAGRLLKGIDHGSGNVVCSEGFGLRLIALRSLSDADAAEEVVQETLARGLDALDNGRLDAPEKLTQVYLRLGVPEGNEGTEIKREEVLAVA